MLGSTSRWVSCGVRRTCCEGMKGWHLFLHLYKRLKEEWSGRQQQLIGAVADTDVGIL